MVDTKKFSQFNNAGNIQNSNLTAGLGSGLNVLFNNPWTFLAPGTTGERPLIAPSMYYRLRFNTTLEIYEYFDPTIPLWVELSGSGTGTVNPGVANDIAFYAASGQAISPIAGAINAVLVTNGLKVPSLSTTLPAGLSIPSATITASTAALLSGSVTAVPILGTDLTNKTYVDSLFSSGVTSATGTTNQVLVNGVAAVPTSGAITLSLPQNIALGSTPTFAGLTLSSIPLGGSSGGTGINNGISTITIGGNFQMVGAFTFAGTLTGNTAVTFPTSGTLATVGATVASITGTANQVLANGTSGSAQVGAVTLTLPQNINTTSSPTFASLTLTTGILSPIDGSLVASFNSLANAVNYLGFASSDAGGYPLVYSTGSDPNILLRFRTTGDAGIQIETTAVTNYPLLIYSGTFNGGLNTGQHLTQFSFPNTLASRVVTFQDASGTLAFLADIPAGSPSALTKTDDTNVTLTLGGSPSTALLQATSLTLGWTGLLAINRGGTNVSSVTTAPTATAFAGWDANSNLSSNNFLVGFATTVSAAGTTTLTVASAGTQEVTGVTTQTIQMPVASTLIAGHPFKIINNSSGNVTLNSSGGNAILVMAANTTAFVTCVLNSGTTAASWNASYVFDNGAGVLSITGTANQVIASASTGAVTLSTPQNINTTSSPTFAGLTLTNPYIAGAGGLHSFQIFTSGTAQTYTRPANVTSILVEVIGGGGGGGGCADPGATNTSSAGGGGGGGYARLFISSASATYTYTVGAGGAGGIGGNNGAAGGTTTFNASSLQATGGGGGLQGAANAATAADVRSGGAPGVGSGTGAISGGGNSGHPGITVLGKVSAGNGGSSIYGGGGLGVINSVGTGAAGTGYGGGGGGASASSGSAQTGGAGSAGLIVVWEFA